MMEMPDWSKYGATKSTTSSLSEVMVMGATTMSRRPDTRSPTSPLHSPELCTQQVTLAHTWPSLTSFRRPRWLEPSEGSRSSYSKPISPAILRTMSGQ